MVHVFGRNLCSRSFDCISFLLILPSSVLVFFCYSLNQFVQVSNFTFVVLLDRLFFLYQVLFK